MKKYLAIAFSIIFSLSINHDIIAQLLYEKAEPYADRKMISETVPEIIILSQAVIDSMRNAYYQVPDNNTFALAADLSVNPSNSGLNIKEKGKKNIWYCRIRSDNAKSLNLIFSKFKLLNDEKLFLYNADLSQIRGPFTSSNNKKNEILATAPVAGEEIIIEYHYTGSDAHERLEVGQLAHDFIGIAGGYGTKDEFYGNSQPCNVDINCNSGNDWQIEKNSVVRIIAAGVELGTGFLVNNTNQQNIAYLITANHVVETVYQASSSVFFFRYESPYCEGPDGIADYTLSGSALLAEDEEIDFTIVELDDFPPITYKPYLAGWDVTGDIPDSTYSIHHPSGDVKKISTDLDPPVIDTFLDQYEDGYWKILEWDEGTTEGGSSGSPLFNPDHRAMGLLTGGEAACGRSVNDYYARMDIAYDTYTELYRSLLPWLDPARSGIKVLDGRDPYAENKFTFDTICNCPDDQRILTEYELPGLGYTTGFNSDSIVMYAEKFNAGSNQELTEIIFEIGVRRFIEELDSITVYLMTGTNEPESVIARRTTLIKESIDYNDLLIDFLEPVPVPEEFFVAWQLWYTDKAIAKRQQFTVFHGSPVGISQNTAFLKDENGWHPFYEHPYQQDALNLCVSVILASNTVYNDIEENTNGRDMIILYPNPFEDRIYIKSGRAYSQDMQYEIFEITGKLVRKGRLKSFNRGSVSELDLSSLKPGIYNLILSDGEIYSAKKIISK